MANSKYINFLEGMLIGGSLGAAGVFIFGTKEGRHLQEEIVDKYHQLVKKTHQCQNIVKKALKKPTKKIQRLAKKAVHKSHAGKKKSRRK